MTDSSNNSDEPEYSDLTLSRPENGRERIEGVGDDEWISARRVVTDCR